MTIKVTAEEFAKGVVISAAIPSEVGTDEYKPWSMDIHNAGAEGIFGAGIVHVSGPGNIVILWEGEEFEMSPDPDKVSIWQYVDENGNPIPMPNCTHIKIDAEIKFVAEGTYVIQIHGVHQEPDGWWSDDYREFTVVVTGVVEEYCSLSGVVTGLFGMAVSGVTVKLDDEKRTTDAAGAYAFVKVKLGSYTLKVTPGFLYEPYEKELSLTVVNKLYTENVGLSLKSLIKYGVPLALVAGVGGVVYVKRIRAPTIPAVFEAPPGYRLVRE